MLGLILLGVSFFYGMAIGVAVGVSLTMVASLTLMPALLSLPRAEGAAPAAAPRDPGRHLRRRRRARSLWARWAELRRPASKIVLSVAAAAVIVVLSIPFFSIRLGHADQGNDPAGSTTRKGYDLISQGFGVGFNSVLVAGGQRARPAGDGRQGRGGGEDRAQRRPGRRSSCRPKPLTATVIDRVDQDGDLARGRQDHRPGQQPAQARAAAAVRGHAAITSTCTGRPRSTSTSPTCWRAKMPLFIGAVVILSFLLLMLAFRSLVIPLTAAVMNLFAAGASFGVIVAVFQWGWFSEALGIGKGGPIEAFAPALFFAILFGLSMDYQVFLVSRMHEEWVHTGDNDRAISVGQGQTGGIITAAAIIMICVFGGFLLGDNRVVKLVGLGPGVSAIFIDAFILRTVLVPALMHLAGRANWYFPKWLDRVTPRLSIEPPESDRWPNSTPSRTRTG